jgi:hypothetical protein
MNSSVAPTIFARAEHFDILFFSSVFNVLHRADCLSIM